MKFDVLHNFISPVTGRVLSDYNYVLVGNKQGIAIPSPILIDIRLDLINLRRDFNHLADASFIVGFANDQIPNAQVLKSLSNGFMFNTEGIVSTTAMIPIGALPNLTYNTFWIGNVNNRPIEILVLPLLNLTGLSQGKLWIGNASGRPAESQIIDITNLPDLSYNFVPILGGGRIWRGNISGRPVESDSLNSVENSLNLLSFVTIPSIQADLLALQGQIVIIQGQIIGLLAFQTTTEIELNVLHFQVNHLHLEGFVISGTRNEDNALITSRGPTCLLTNIPAGGDVSIDNFKITNLADPIDPKDGVNLETLQTYVGNNGAKFLTGFVVGGPPVAGTIAVSRGFTDLDMLGYRVTNLQQSPVETLDAISAQFLWDLMHDEVEVIWQ